MVLAVVEPSLSPRGVGPTPGRGGGRGREGSGTPTRWDETTLRWLYLPRLTYLKIKGLFSNWQKFSVLQKGPPLRCRPLPRPPFEVSIA